jgi:hypothetical protein
MADLPQSALLGLRQESKSSIGGGGGVKTFVIITMYPNLKILQVK